MKKKRRLGRMLRRWEHEDYGESVTQETFPGNFYHAFGRDTSILARMFIDGYEDYSLDATS